MRLTYSPAAQSDLRQFGQYLRREANAATALDQLTRIRATAARLIDFPQMGPPLGEEGFRVLTVRGTPYSLVYAIMPDEVRILRAFHQAQDWRPPEP